MATVRSRAVATSTVELRNVNPSASQSGAQTATPQTTPSHPATPQPPIATQSAVPSIPGTPQTAQSQPAVPAPSQAASTSSPPNNSNSVSPSPNPASSATLGIKSKWEIWGNRINTPVGWISIMLALIALDVAYRTLNLQAWSARNDHRGSCWTDWDHGVYSKACNETLAHSATPPPVKRAEESQEQSFELQERDLFWRTYITLVVPMVLILIRSYLSRGRDPRCHDGSATTWGEYQHRIRARSPFSRPTWLPSIPKVNSMLVYVPVGMVSMILDFVDPDLYTKTMILLATATIPVYWCVTDNFIATRQWSSEKAFRAAV